MFYNQSSGYSQQSLPYNGSYFSERSIDVGTRSTLLFPVNKAISEGHIFCESNNNHGRTTHSKSTETNSYRKFENRLFQCNSSQLYINMGINKKWTEYWYCRSSIVSLIISQFFCWYPLAILAARFGYGSRRELSIIFGLIWLISGLFFVLGLVPWIGFVTKAESPNLIVSAFACSWFLTRNGLTVMIVILRCQFRRRKKISGSIFFDFLISKFFAGFTLLQLLNESQQQFSWYDVSRTSSEEGMIQKGMIQEGMIQEGMIPTGYHTEVADDNYAVKSVQSKFTISKLISTSYASTMSY